jgi:hypothetical protein
MRVLLPWAESVKALCTYVLASPCYHGDGLGEQEEEEEEEKKKIRNPRRKNTTFAEL